MSAKSTSSEHYSTDSSSDDSEQNDQYNDNLPQSSHNNSAVNLLNRRMSYLSPIMPTTTEPIINDTGYVREETRQSIRRQSIMIVMKNEEIRKEKVEKLLLEREIIKKESHNVKKGTYICSMCSDNINICIVKYMSQ